MCSCLAHRFVTGLNTDVEALLAVSIIRLGQYVVDVMENVALVQELVVGLLEFETPAPKRRSHNIQTNINNMCNEALMKLLFVTNMT